MSNGDPNGQDVAVAEKDERTRNRLLRAGIQVFDRKGYDAASVREIVELAGVTKPALYYHFGSKEGLLRAILDESEKALASAMARALARPGTTRDRLIAVAEDMFGLFEQHISVVRVTHSIFLGPTDIAPDFDFEVYERRLVEALEQIVREGQARGEALSANPEDVAVVVMGILGAVASRKLHQRSIPISVEGMRRLMNLVFDGVLKDSGSVLAAGESRQ